MSKKNQIVIGLVLATLLTSCNTRNSEPSAPAVSGSESDKVTVDPIDLTKSLTRPTSDAADGAPTFLPPITNLPAGVTQPTSFLNEINDVYWNIGLDALNAWPTDLTDVQKMLVVPVSFSDKRSIATEAMREDISKTFFGKASDTGWESVASYYYKSSRGKLTLTGEVTPWFNLSIETLDVEDYDDVESKVIRTIYDNLPASKLREYDLNQDGWLDGLWIVYAADIGQYDIDNYWAYVSWVYANENKDKPYPGVFGWASYQFMYEGGDANLPQFLDENRARKVDAHTFIHETGHMLGLTDYYDYDGKRNPSGGIDMMGSNVIDHNAYSKFLLQWNQPYVPNGITEETRIHLRPATTSGDFILLKNDWNGSVFDEYILIEYYTPDVLNYQDSSVAYNTNYSRAKGYQESGARVWHVDSSLWAGPIVNNWYSYSYRVNPDPETGDVYKDVPKNKRPELETDDVHFVNFGASNTGSESRDDSFSLLKLVDASTAGSYYISAGRSSTAKSLFKPGNEISNWATFLKNQTGKFNDGNDIGFNVRFGEMNENGIEVFITKTI